MEDEKHNQNRRGARVTKDRRLTPKQYKYVLGKLEGKTDTQAAQDAYDIKSSNPGNVAGVIASHNNKNELIRNAIDQALTDSLLATKHLALLNKEETIVKIDKDGQPNIIKTGEIDVMAVSKALDLAYKIKGTFAPEKKITVTIDSNAETLKLAQEYEQKLKETIAIEEDAS